MDVESFCNLLARSQVLPTERIKSLYAQWRSKPRPSRDAGVFIDWLEKRKHLTRWQAKILRKGDLDRFSLGPYRLVDRIAKGDVAGTYKAIDPQGGVVAIKILPRSRAQDAETLSRFKREGKLAKQLNHPNIVHTYELAEAKGVPYLVMEFLDGMTLEDVLKGRERLTPLEVTRIGFLTALGLRHIHEHKLIHRDLNPKNLMLCPAPKQDGTTLGSNIKILDVGFGRRLFDPTGTQSTEGLTDEEDVIGSRDYVSPEQARDARRVDIRTDIYSLGCILYHALTGASPFKDDNSIRQILRHANEEPRPLDEIVDGLPAKLNRSILTMLAKELVNRQNDPKQVADELKVVLAELSPMKGR